MRPSASRQGRGLGLRAASAAAALCRLPIRAGTAEPGPPRLERIQSREGGGGMTPGTARGYNFAYLDEQTKRMIRRAILKAVAIPRYQVPFAGREMPLPYGWGTGGIQVTAAIIGADDVHKV